MNTREVIPACRLPVNRFTPGRHVKSALIENIPGSRKRVRITNRRISCHQVKFLQITTIKTIVKQCRNLFSQHQYLQFGTLFEGRLWNSIDPIGNNDLF